MKKLFLLLVAFTLSVSLIVTGLMPVFASTLLASYTTGDTAGAGAWEVQWLCQTFTATQTNEVTSVKIKAYRVGNPGIVAVSIQETDENGKPDGNQLTWGTTNGNTLTTGTDGEWREITLETGCTLENSVKYALVWRAPGGDSVNKVVARYDATGAYSGGHYLISGDGGISWVSYTGLDFVFEVWGGGAISEPIGVTLEASEIEYNGFLDWFEVKLNGSVGYDGNEPCNVSFYYREDGTSEWSLVTVNGLYTTGQEFQANVYELLPEKTYEYLAFVWNSSYVAVYTEGEWLAKTETGVIVEFTTDFPVEAPSVTTYAYPIDKDVDALTCRIYGKVLIDGGSDVDVWFRYRETYPTTGDWVLTSETTGLNTGDDFDKLLTDLAIYPQVYEYEAVGENETGVGYGGIATFRLTPLTAPEVRTDGVDFVSDTTATLYGYIVDDGGDPSGCSAQFQYRVAGSQVWLNSPGVAFVVTDDSYNTELQDLLPETTYQYRAYGWVLDDDFVKLEGFGAIKVFGTMRAVSIPYLTTNEGEYLTDTAVRLSGTLDYHGGLECELGFQYRLVGSANWTETEKVTSSTSPVDYIRIIFDLEEGEQYEYRAIGINAEGYGYGEIRKFMIDPDDDVITTPTPVIPGVDPGPVIDIFGALSDTVKSIASMFFMGVCWFWSYRQWKIKWLSLVLTAVSFWFLVIIHLMPIWLSVAVAIFVGFLIFRLVKR